MHATSEKLILGYKAASELTGLPLRYVQGMAERRKIRVVRLWKRRVAFYPSELLADIRAMQTNKIE
jgi:hypothetical protein